MDEASKRTFEACLGRLERSWAWARLKERRQVTVLAICGLLWLIACGGTTAARERERLTLLQQVRSLEDQLAAAQAQVARLSEREAESSQQKERLQARLETCEAERIRLVSSDKGTLDQRLSDCRSQNQKEHQQGVIEGKLSVLNSVTVAGEPEVVEGFFTNDYYYRFEVRVENRRFALMRIRTHKEETAFGSVLASIKDLRPAVLKR